MVARVEATGAKLVAVSNWWILDTTSEEGILSVWLSFLVDAVESKRWQKRVKRGLRGKIVEWLWPFPAVPVWYDRITETIWGKEIKFLIKKEPQASIIKEWLELFAEWVILTKQQLFEFFDERWLKSNSKKNKTGKLHPSIVDRILDLWKLFVYAWYITYPDWDVNELIEWKHPAIIDPDTVDKIMKRLYKNSGTTEYKKRTYDYNAEEYPLTRILHCPECDKGVTKWKSKSKTWAYHHYYWCNTKGCSLYKKSIKINDVHQALKDRLKEITPPSDIAKTFDRVFLWEWKQSEKDIDSINKDKKKKIGLIEDELERIEKTLDNITDNALFKKKQERRAELNQEKENLEYDMEDVRFTQNEFEKTYNQAKLVITKPLALWNLEDIEIKQLLIRVCFNNQISYSKKNWLHTPQISVLYTIFNKLWNDETLNLEMMGFEPMSKRHT